jgi:hypothetical protein
MGIGFFIHAAGIAWRMEYVFGVDELHCLSYVVHLANQTAIIRAIESHSESV